MMYLDISQYTWYTDAYAHYWGGSASDQNVQMVKVSGEDYVYYGKIPSGAANILFVRIVSGTWYNQTYDWNNFGSINYFKLSSEGEKVGMSSGTYIPKMSTVSITNNGTILGGSGTSSAPYLVAPSATIKVKGSSTSVVADDNMTAHYQFMNGSTTAQSYSTTATYSFTASSTIGTTYTLTVKARNNYNSTNGTEKESSAIYFKVADPLSTGVTLRGTFNEWSSSANEFRRKTAGATTATTTITFANAKQSERFLVYVDGDKYGNSGTILSSTNSAWGFNKDGEDCYFNTACAGTYTFTWDITNKKLSVTYPEETHPSSNYVYFLDDNSWGAVSAHLYDTGNGDKITNWPGQPLRTVTIDEKTYYLCAPGAKTQIIFTNGNISSLKRLPQEGTTLSPSSGLAKYHNSKAGGTTTTWKDFEFTVVLKRNGGDTDGSAKVKWNKTTLVSGNTFVAPTREGYKVSKFTINADASSAQMAIASGGGTFAANTSYTNSNKEWVYPNSGATFYAQWTANKYTVTFDQTGCTPSTYTSQDFTYDAALSTINSLHRPTPPTGYDYLGYSTKDGTNGDWGELLTDGTGHWNAVEGYTAQVGGDIVWKCELTTLYSKIAPQTYNITYKDQGDKTFSGAWGETAHPTTHTYNTATTLVNAPDKTGYTFGGWFTSSNCEGAAVTELGVTAYTADITLYAKWNPTTTAITLDRQDGSATKEIVATYDGNISAVTGLADADYQRTGYTFNGMRIGTSSGSAQVIIRVDNAWAFQTNAGSSIYTNSANPPVWKYTGSTLNLYTSWTANQYTITLSDNGGTGGSGTTQVTFDAKPASVNVPTKVVSEIAQIFTGYYYNDVQIFNNSGAIVMNAGGGTYTDNSGNWKYDDELELTAKWEAPAQQKVFFGVTNGTAADETSGTVSAIIKSTSTEISSGDEIDAGTVITISFSAKKGQYIDNNGWKIASWWDGANTSTANKLADAAGNSTSYDYTIPTKESSVYAYAPEVTNTFSIVVNSEQTRMGSVDPAQGTAGPNVMQQITATPTNEGYSFVNWTQTGTNFAFVEGTSANDATAKVALKNQSGQTITANFKINDYTITYTGLEAGSTHSNPETYTIETETITFTPATSILGHVFTGWSPASIETGSTGNQTITAQYYAVSLAPVASANIIEGKQATITPNFTAPTGTYYYEYTCASISTFDVGANGVATFTAPAAGDYIITVNVYEGSDNTGVKLATTNVNITVAEDLTANWYIVGQSGLLPQQTGDWQRSETYRFSKPSKDAKSAYIDLVITEEQVNNTYEFKLQDCGQNNNPMYGWGTNEGYYHTFTKTETWGIYNNDGSDHNLKIIPKMAGTYRFSIDWSNNQHNLTVTYPAESHHMVTVDNGKTQTQVQVNEYTETALVAEQHLNGKRFNGWVVTNAAGEDKSGSIHINNPQDYSTHMYGATEEGLIVRATFTTEGMIYFDKSDIKDSWTGDVFVYFYDNSYWDGNKGTGSKNIHSGPHKMSKIGNSDIYYFDYSNVHRTSKYISFADHEMNQYENFAGCQATYRGDFETCAPVFVARNYKEYKNTDAKEGQAVYFNKGYWRTYQSTNPGYSITIWQNKQEKASGNFTSETTLGNDFTFTANLEANTGYYFKIAGCNGTWYGNQGTMTKDCNWEFDSEGTYENNCGLTTTAKGDYKFTLNCTNGWLRVSVEYPLSVGDYRLAYEELSGSDINKIHPTHHIKALHEEGTKVDTVSFFVEQKANAFIHLQECTHIDGTNITWANVSGNKVDLSSFDQAAGVYNFTLTQTMSGATLTPEVAFSKAYEGPYYIRTDCARGGWSSYNIKDNEMTQSDVLKRNMVGKGDYNYYFAQWATAGTNVKYCVANKYSEALTDSLKADTYTTVEGHDAAANQTLPYDANVRFMWNSTTNRLERAYLNGSTNDADRYLMLVGNPSEDAAHIYNTEETPARFPNDSVKLDDKGNWTYQIDIKADVQARGKLVANYNGQEQYFKGSEGEFADETTEQIIGGTDNTKKYGVRIVYDFKTNNMVAGWMPSNDLLPIDEQLAIYADVILVRHAQEAAQAITFSGSGALTDVKTIYGAIELRKDETVDRLNSWTPYAYSVCNYYVSFPFDVKLSEVFGIGDYGTTWQMQYYDGVKRAEIGWFAETSTFWTTLSKDSTLHAHTGYLLQINKNVLNKADGAIWVNSKEHANAYIYFPSAELVGGLSAKSVPVPVIAHECTIDRTFTQDAEKEEGLRRNHKITDSHWNMIGLPIFQNEKRTVIEDKVFTENLHYVYQWGIEDSTKIGDDTDNRTNTMEIVAVGTDFNFKAMHSYMVQYYGDITWTGSAITPAAIAARDMETKNYKVDLQLLNNNSRAARTYIEMAAEANQDFRLNEDVYMMTSSADANLYSFAGAYDVAANVLPIENQTVELGVIVNKAGTYTFTTPSAFSGTVSLIDRVANVETDLMLGDYEIYLPKGTIEGRFALKMLINKADVETSLDNINGMNKLNDGKAHKFIRNNRMFILRDGKVFDAIGSKLR